MLKSIRMPALGAALLVSAIGGALALQHPTLTRAADETVGWAVPTTSSTTINVGDTVTWDWADALPHSVTTVTGPVTFDSGVLTGDNQTFAFTFTQAGTYTYRCIVHPNGMTGTVTVQAAQAEPTATATTPAQPTATTPAQPTATTPAQATATTPAQPTAPSATTPITGGQTITLNGGEEVPPITTTATGTFQYKLDGQTLSYVLKANGTGMTMAHIHLGDKGANGPVITFLFGPNQAGVNSIDVGGTITAANLTGSLANDMPGFINALNRGGLYVNVHSIEHPAGLLRGQIPAPVSPGVPATGSGVLEGGESGSPFASFEFAMLAAIILLGGSAVAVINRRRGSAQR